MKHPISSFLLAGSFLLSVGTARAQVTFSVGPKVGLHVSTAHFSDVETSPSYRTESTQGYRTGLEAGVVGLLAIGHFALQPALLYTQKGYRQTTTTTYAGSQGQQVNQFETNRRLDYLTIPLNLTFTQHKNGQGFQVFAGPYVSCLVRGREEDAYTADGVLISTYSLPVHGVFGTVGDNPNLYGSYSQRLDGGFQGGLGYRAGSVLVQANYSLGLRDLGPRGSYGVADPFYNRAFQASLAYLFQLKG